MVTAYDNTDNHFRFLRHECGFALHHDERRMDTYNTYHSGIAVDNVEVYMEKTVVGIIVTLVI